LTRLTDSGVNVIQEMKQFEIFYVILIWGEPNV